MGDFEGKVEVSTAETWLTAGLEPVGVENERIVTGVAGHVNGNVKTSTSCVLSGVFLRYRYEAFIEESADFDFGLVAPGSYILACIHDRKIVLLQPVDIIGGQGPLEVEMGARLSQK